MPIIITTCCKALALTSPSLTSHFLASLLVEVLELEREVPDPLTIVDRQEVKSRPVLAAVEPLVVLLAVGVGQLLGALHVQDVEKHALNLGGLLIPRPGQLAQAGAELVHAVAGIESETSNRK